MTLQINALIIVLCVILLGCEHRLNTTSEITGVVIKVNVESFETLNSISVKDNSGKTWKFHANNFQGFTPSHLREHAIQGLPVTVKFHAEKDKLIIDEITD